MTTAGTTTGTAAETTGGATDLKGITAIVTGGGTGIGRSTAVLLAQRGANVLVVGRRPEPLVALADELPGVRAEVADVGEEQGVERVVTAALAAWDRVDVVVNNAGAFVGAPLESVTSGQIQHLLRVNVVAPTLMARAALPHLSERGGAIVNVTSTYARKAAPRAGHYAAAKAALESLTRSWALELAPARIRVNAVSPGPTETGLLASSGVPEAMIEKIKQRETATIPLGRRGEPGDVARWVVELCEPSAGWVTGQIIGVDGGLGVV
jgi:NAD(P)-dependent dehydrogenase (short-subunit alcohol dehydrogenase family)